MGRKKHEVHEEHENHERWLVSYADFITLLFAFFVILFALNQSAAAKMAAIKKAAESMKLALDGSSSSKVTIIDGGSSGNSKGPDSNRAQQFEAKETQEMAAKAVAEAEQRRNDEKAAASAEKHAKAKRKLEARLAKFMSTAHSVVSVFSDGKRLAIRLQASSFFDERSDRIRPEFMPILDAVADELRILERPVRIEGHASRIFNPSLEEDEKQWKLSSYRAAEITWYLANAGRMNRKLLMASGLADTRPLDDSDTETAKEMNRRIELVVMLDSEDDLSDIAP